MALDFDFTEEQEQFRLRVRDFAKKEIAPLAPRWDETSEFPWESMKRLAQAGYTGLVYPRELGGQGKTYVELGILAEELGRVDPSCAMICCLQNSWGQPPVMWPKEVRVGVIKGERFFAFASTEPGTGSDSAAIKTEARREGDEWVVNGAKRYISFLPAAWVAAITIRTAPGTSARGISLIMVELDFRGAQTEVFYAPQVQGELSYPVFHQLPDFLWLYLQDFSRYFVLANSGIGGELHRDIQQGIGKGGSLLEVDERPDIDFGIS